MKKTESYKSVWDAIADTPEQAANLRARAELMMQISELVKANGYTQAEATTWNYKQLELTGTPPMTA